MPFYRVRVLIWSRGDHNELSSSEQLPAHVVVSKTSTTQSDMLEFCRLTAFFFSRRERTPRPSTCSAAGPSDHCSHVSINNTEHLALVSSRFLSFVFGLVALKNRGCQHIWYKYWLIVIFLYSSQTWKFSNALFVKLSKVMWLSQKRKIKGYVTIMP